MPPKKPKNARPPGEDQAAESKRPRPAAESAAEPAAEAEAPADGAGAPEAIVKKELGLEAAEAVTPGLAKAAPAADGGGKGQVGSGPGRAAGVLNASQKVAFCRWMNREGLGSSKPKGMELDQLKSKWLVDPEAAKNWITSTSTTSSSSERSQAFLWLTAQQIAKEEGFKDVAADPVQQLLKGLDRRPSRFPHLRSNELFDEFHYGAAEKLEEKEGKATATNTNSSADLSASELQQVVESMHDSGQGSGLMNEPAQGKAAAKAKAKTKAKAKAKAVLSEEDRAQRERTSSLTKLHSSLVSELKATRSTLTLGRTRDQAEPWLKELCGKVQASMTALEEEERKLSAVLGTSLEQAFVDSFCSRVESMLKAHRSGFYKSLRRVLAN